MKVYLIIICQFIVILAFDQMEVNANQELHKSKKIKELIFFAEMDVTTYNFSRTNFVYIPVFESNEDLSPREIIEQNAFDLILIFDLDSNSFVGETIMCRDGSMYSGFDDRRFWNLKLVCRNDFSGSPISKYTKNLADEIIPSKQSVLFFEEKEEQIFLTYINDSGVQSFIMKRKRK